MIKNKKGAELSLNIIIIAIIVIVVLVVVIAFFTGTITGITQRIRGTAPDPLDIAVQECTGKCQLAQSSFDSPTAKRSSSYCKKTINVDTNSDGIADEKHRCWSSTIGIDCPGVTNECRAEAIESLTR